MSLCLVCKKGQILPQSYNDSWYECTSCGADSDRLVDGYLYPLERRGTLCSLYTPVIDLDVSRFKAGDTIEFETSRKTKKNATIVHVDQKDNKMIIEEEGTKRIRFVIDNEIIVSAYDALFPDNKVKFAGWWNRRIVIL